MPKRRNKGHFKPGFDPRRHILTADERKRGGLNCAQKFTVIGRWRPDWWDRCRAKMKGEF